MRGALIAYGIALYAILVPVPGALDRPALLTGVALQIGLVLARRLVPCALAPAVELVVDAVTVLVFGWSTFRAVAGVLAEL